MKKSFLPPALCLCIGLVGGCTGSQNQGQRATPTRTATVAPSPTSAPPTVMMPEMSPTPAQGAATEATPPAPGDTGH